MLPYQERKRKRGGCHADDSAGHAGGRGRPAKIFEITYRIRTEALPHCPENSAVSRTGGGRRSAELGAGHPAF